MLTLDPFDLVSPLLQALDYYLIQCLYCAASLRRPLKQCDIRQYLIVQSDGVESFGTSLPIVQSIAHNLHICADDRTSSRGTTGQNWLAIPLNNVGTR